jgi:hypothetical protein
VGISKADLLSPLAGPNWRDLPRPCRSTCRLERVVCLAASRAVVLVSARQPEPQTPAIEVSPFQSAAIGMRLGCRLMLVPYSAEPYKTRVLKTSLSDEKEAELKATRSTHSRSRSVWTSRSLQLIEPDRGTRCFVSF